MTQQKDWEDYGRFLIVLAGVSLLMGFMMGGFALYYHDTFGGWLSAITLINAVWGLMVGSLMVDKGKR